MTSTVLPASTRRSQHGQQLAHVLEVQAGGRLVEQVERAAGVALGELARQLDALRLAARQRGRRLAERDVAEADVVQRLQDAARACGGARTARAPRRRGVSSTSAMLLSFHFTAQRRLVVALALADLAGDVDVGQEVHLDLAHAVALARLAAAALHVEREAPRLVAVGARLRRLREHLADQVERLGVRRRVRARRAADRLLVDVDHLVDLRRCRDGAVCAPTWS